MWAKWASFGAASLMHWLNEGFLPHLKWEKCCNCFRFIPWLNTNFATIKQAWFLPTELFLLQMWLKRTCLQLNCSWSPALCEGAAEAVIAQLAVVSDWASQESATVWMCALLSACHCCFPKPGCALVLLPFFLIHSCVTENWWHLEESRRSLEASNSFFCWMFYFNPFCSKRSLIYFLPAAACFY